MQKTERQRVLYIDALRVLACMFIVVLHQSAQKFDKAAVGSYEWTVFNVYDSLTRWAVPVFVMISGALFLDPAKEIRLKTLCRKNLLRIGTAFLFWSALYSIVDYLCGTRLRDVVSGFITGHVHLWFLYMIGGLYLIVPLLRRLVESERQTKYFLFLWALFAVAIPTGVSLVSLFSKQVSDWLSVVMKEIGLEYVLGFTGYFILGHMLHTHEIPKNLRLALYGLGAAGAAATIVLTYFASRKSGLLNDSFYSPFSAFVCLTAAAVFTFVKYHMPALKDGAPKKALLTVSDCVFGIYLVHLLIMTQLHQQLNWHVLKRDPLITVPGLAGVVFLLSLAVSFLLRKIPVLKKYIV